MFNEQYQYHPEILLPSAKDQPADDVSMGSSLDEKNENVNKIP